MLGWVAVARPRVLVLTDGSGRTGADRLAASRQVIAAQGAEPGRLFGHASDARFYQAMLALDSGFFLEILEALAAEIETSGASLVIGDAAEGYNPTHDLCRAMIDAAVELVRGRTGRPLQNYAFALTEWETRFAGAKPPVELSLDPSAHAAKVAACRSYAQMDREVDSAIGSKGEAYFALETFWPIEGLSALPLDPLYDAIGADRVRSGAYSQVVHSTRHVEPLAAAIRAYVERETAAPRISAHA